MVDEAAKRPSIAYEWQVLCLVSFLFGITQADWGGINVALPIVIKEFNGSTAMLVWVINAYLVVFAASAVAVGRLADIVGRRKTMIAGSFLFAAGLVLTGLSTDLVVLVCARAICGFGSAIISVVSLSIASSSFPVAKRATAITVWVAAGAVAVALGPFIGGLFTDLLSWRWLFLTNGAATVLGLVVLCVILRESKDENAGKIDLPGVLLLTTALLLLVVGLQFAERFGWLSPWVIGGIVGGLAVLVVFYRVETKAASPLIDFSLFIGRINFLGACIAMFFARFPNGALPLFLSLYLQHIFGLSALETGSVFLVMMVPMASTSYVVARIIVAFGPRLLLAASMALAALGFVCLGIANPRTNFGLMLFGLALFGIGQGLSYNVASALAMSSIPDEKSGAASGILQSINSVALSLGVATTGALFKTTENSRLERLFELAGSRLGPEARTEIKLMLSGSDAARERLAQLQPDVSERVSMVVDEAYIHSFREVMFLFIAVSVLGFVSTFVFGRRNDPDVSGAPDSEASGHR